MYSTAQKFGVDKGPGSVRNSEFCNNSLADYWHYSSQFVAVM